MGSSCIVITKLLLTIKIILLSKILLFLFKICGKFKEIKTKPEYSFVLDYLDFVRISSSIGVGIEYSSIK